MLQSIAIYAWAMNVYIIKRAAVPIGFKNGLFKVLLTHRLQFVYAHVC